MLSPADANLVARDRCLPGLARLLDPDAFRESLQRARPDLNPGAVVFHYLRYKPGTNCLGAFTLDLDGTPVRGYAKAYRSDNRGKLKKVERRPSIAGPLGPGRMVLEDGVIEVVIFPNDNKLKELRSLFDDTHSPKLLDHVFPNLPVLQAGTISHLRYKPERRFVGRLDIDGAPRAVLKLYTEHAYGPAWTATTALDGAAGLIGHSPCHGVLAFAWRDGCLLRASIDGPDPSLATVERTGAALAAFHTRDGAGLRVRDRTSELSTIQATSELVRVLHPPLAPLVDELVASLSAELCQAPVVQRPIHGDFYDRQVMVNDEQIVILDLDEAVLADPAADLGLFIAHLERDALSRDLPASRIAPIRDALLAGYGPLPERVDLYIAFGLLQLAPHHFRHREPDWPERTEATLERAKSVAARRAASLV